jgi:hypothetical protein
MAANESRIEAARRRVRVARYSIGAVAATAFALVGFAVRDAHPATQTNSQSAVTSDDRSGEIETESFDFGGGGSISPSSSFDTPSVQSGGS